MSKLEHKRRLAKDMVNFARSKKYNSTHMKSEYKKYRRIIDNNDRSVKEIPTTALKYNWLMNVGEAVKDGIEQNKNTVKNDIHLWESKEYDSAKEMAIRLVEKEGKHCLLYPNPYYSEPYK